MVFVFLVSETTNKPGLSFDLMDVIVTVLVIVVLALMGAGIFVNKRIHATSSTNPCINNLRQIDNAANQFALEHDLKTGAPIHFPGDLTPFLKLNSAGKIPPCPAGGIYHLTKVGETPTCSMSTLTPAHVLP